MALPIITEQPNSTVQLGPLWTVTGGGGVASTALSDGLDTSYVSLSARCQLDAQVLRLGFAVPSPPAGAKVYSVGVRCRYQQVAALSNRPGCVHWFRSVIPATSGSTVTATTVVKTPQFFSVCPISATATTVFETDTIATFFTAPDGTNWNPATNLSAFTYDMGRDDDGGNPLIVSEVFLDITYQQQATVTVTGPTGTIAGSRAAVTWTYAQPDSQPQQAFQVAIYTQAQTLAGGFVAFSTTPIQSTGGFILGDDLKWVPPYDLADGTYVAYVQVKSKWGGLGDFLSPVASATWTRSASSGGVGTFPPNASVTSAVFDSVNNRVSLTIVPSSSGVVTKYFTVYSSYDNGVTFTPIPSLTLVPANGMTPVIEYDYVAPLNATAQYQVLAYGPSATTPVAAAGFSATQSVLTSGTQPWLKDPQNPLNNTTIPMFAKGNKITRRRVQGTFEVLSGKGNVYPIVVNGPVYGESGTLVLMFTSDQSALFAAWNQLDLSGHVLLFQKTNGTQIWVTLGPGAAGQDTSWEFEAVDPSADLYDKVTLNYQAVSPPSYY